MSLTKLAYAYGNLMGKRAELHSHEGGSAQDEFEESVDKELATTRLARSIIGRGAMIKKLKDYMELPKATGWATEGDVLGMKGQAFAVGEGKNPFYVMNKDEWSPGVLAHELGHIKSMSGPESRVDRALMGYGHVGGAGLLGGSMLLRGKARALGALGGLGTLLYAPRGRLNEEARATEYGLKGLQKIRDEEGFLYDEEAYDAADETLRSAFSTYEAGMPSHYAEAARAGVAAGALGLAANFPSAAMEWAERSDPVHEKLVHEKLDSKGLPVWKKDPGARPWKWSKPSRYGALALIGAAGAKHYYDAEKQKDLALRFYDDAGVQATLANQSSGFGGVERVGDSISDRLSARFLG